MTLREAIFGCTHSNLSRVFTGPRKIHRATKHWPRGINIGKRDYKVCLDCGREFDFDWLNLGAIENTDNLRIAEAVVQEAK